MENTRKKRTLDVEEQKILDTRLRLMEAIALVTNNPTDFLLCYMEAASLLLYPITYEKLMDVSQFEINIKERFQHKS